MRVSANVGAFLMIIGFLQGFQADSEKLITLCGVMRLSIGALVVSIFL